MEYYSSLDASQLDAETPTLFELISANQLELLLSPTLRYILVHYAQRYPLYLLRITNKFDEINLFLRTFVEWYFIKYWQGSFTENFYGIKRVAQTPLSDGRYNNGKLTQLVPLMIEQRRELLGLQRWVSIFEITGSAYLLEKLTYQYELLYSKYVTNQLDETKIEDPREKRLVWLRRKYVEIFPTLQAAWRGANLLATLLFLSGASKLPSLLTFLFRINYARLNQYNYQKNEPPMPKDKSRGANRVAPPGVTEAILRGFNRILARPSWRVVKYILGTFFPVAIFTLKFLEWWSNSDLAQRVAKSQTQVLEKVLPPPLTMAQLAARKSGKIYKSGNTCPICKNEILNPAIIETGYVFCYTCIYNYLRDSHKLFGANVVDEVEDSEDESRSETEEDSGHHEDTVSQAAIDGGGRCPITGQKLLGCKFNALTGEFDVDGIRRLVF